MMTGVNMVHVPYRSVAAGITDLLSGQVQVTFGTTASTIEYIRAGTLRALAVTTATRSETLPDLPTIAEFVPGYEASAWFGAGAPRNTPAEIVNKLNSEINACLADPKLKARIAELGGASQSRAHLPTSEGSSLKKPRSGPRWSDFPVPRRNDSVISENLVLGIRTVRMRPRQAAQSYIKLADNWRNEWKQPSCNRMRSK